MDNTKSIREQILVVDDDPHICQTLADALEDKGYRPITCINAKDALSVSEREPFDLAFIDIHLPDMNGLDLASKLKENDLIREVIFITGYGTFDNAVQAIKIGAYDYLAKPFGINDFNLCLKRFEERQALREQVRLTEQRYFHLVQNIPLVIFLLRRDFHLDFVNDACSTILGFAPNEALNTRDWFLDRIYTEDRKRIKNLFELAFKSGGPPFSSESRLIHKDGHLIHAILKSIPHSDNRRGLAIDRMEGIIIDITDRVFFERAMVQEEKLKTVGAISEEVAHEIRNPLVSIGGFARRLQQKFPNLAEGTIILNEARRLEKTLERIRNYLKPVRVVPKECSINKVITHCMDLLSPEMERNQVISQMELDPGLSTISVDQELIVEIFINLIRNSIKTIDKGGQLIIKTFESDQNLYITFNNKTLKQKVKDPEHLFLPFDEGGQGVGLSVCYKLLKNMGGLLCFEQEVNDMTFTVSLPKKDSLAEG